jgi:arabinose-5-phosphate isomerase
MPHPDPASGAGDLPDASRALASSSVGPSAAEAPALTAAEQTRVVGELLEAEIAAIRGIPADNPFHACVGLFLSAAAAGGKVIVSGVGKAGEIGRKIATTFCSVGVPSAFLHPLEAQHGDLGVLHDRDVLFLISNSGRTREIVELKTLARHLHPTLPIILLTGNRDGELARAAHCVLWNGDPREICPLGLTPTTSTTTMAVIGDILASLIVTTSRYSAAEYALRHHSGYLGEKSKRDAASRHRPGAGGGELRAIYELLHRTNADYQQHNWLLEDLPLVAAQRPASLLEIGAGNGRFARAIVASVPEVHAVDWVEAPGMAQPALPPSLRFVLGDLRATPFPRVDLAASADVLEHLAPGDLQGVIAALAASAPRQFHTIACYMDSRNLHLTVGDEAQWLARFTAVDPAFRVLKRWHRRGRGDQPAITIVRGI